MRKRATIQINTWRIINVNYSAPVDHRSIKVCNLIHSESRASGEKKVEVDVLENKLNMESPYDDGHSLPSNAN